MAVVSRQNPSWDPRTIPPSDCIPSQMRDKKVWTPVHLSVLTNTEKHGIIRSQMFLKEKYLPTGAFEKLKARLVAGGNQQDKELYDDLSSPTVSTCAVMTVFSIAAYENRKAVVVDIGGAYLNADMNTGVDVYMRLDATMSKMMTSSTDRTSSTLIIGDV